MKKFTLFIIAIMTILPLTSCSNTTKKKTNSNLTETKYTKVVSELKTKLSSINDITWKFKKTSDITNADISKGIMIEVFPKSEEDSRKLEDISTYASLGKESSQSQITALQKKVSEVAKSLPNDNIEISLGFQSRQKSKGVIPVAESIKSMDAIPIHSSK